MRRDGRGKKPLEALEMNFEWHPRKAARNLQDHGVSFEEAQTVFDDPFQMHFPDEAHSRGERRFIAVGESAAGRVLMVVYTEQQDGAVRLISAREATRREQKSWLFRNSRGTPHIL
jgi:uncharacterized protein